MWQTNETLRDRKRKRESEEDIGTAELKEGSKENCVHSRWQLISKEVTVVRDRDGDTVIENREIDGDEKQRIAVVYVDE